MSIIIDLPTPQSYDEYLEESKERRGKSGIHYDLRHRSGVSITTSKDMFEYFGHEALKLNGEIMVSHGSVRGVFVEFFGDNVTRFTDRHRATSLAIQTVHGAYAGQVAISLTPDLLWYMIVHEVSEYVRQQSPKGTNPFFGDGVPSVNLTNTEAYYRPTWEPGAILPRLLDSISGQASHKARDLFLPDFSSTGDADRLAVLTALSGPIRGAKRLYLRKKNHFFDELQPEAKYCGFPQIRLGGTAQDWLQLYTRTQALAELYIEPAGYFSGLLPVLRSLQNFAAGEFDTSDDFWHRLYVTHTRDDGRLIGGWLMAFFAFTQAKHHSALRQEFGSSAMFVNQFPRHLSRTPMSWSHNNEQQHFALFSGVTTVEHDGTFLEPRLGFAIVKPRQH